MKIIQKKLIAIFLLTFLVAIPLGALAQTTGSTASTLNISGKLATVGSSAGFGSRPIAQTIGQIINVFLSILGLIFLTYTVYAGYLYLISAGNEEKVDKAKSILRGSIIGLIIVLSAYAITRFVIYGVGRATSYNVGSQSDEPFETTD